jgi:hypothetical protein
LAGRDGDDGVAVVELAGEPRGELQIVHARAEVLEHGVAVGGHLRGIVGERELVADLRLLEVRSDRLVALDLIAKARGLGHDGLGGVRVVPEAGLARLLLQGRDIRALGVEVQVLADAHDPRAHRRYVLTAVLDHRWLPRMTLAAAGACCRRGEAALGHTYRSTERGRGRASGGVPSCQIGSSRGSNDGENGSTKRTPSTTRPSEKSSVSTTSMPASRAVAQSWAS